MKTAIDYIRDAQNAFRQGKWQEAIKYYDKVIELMPDSSMSYYNKGTIFHTLREYEEAIKCFDKAIELKSDYAAAYNNKGGALERLGKYQEAIKCLDKAIELKSNYADAYYNKGNALDDLGKYQEAVKCYDKVIELEPYNALCLCLRAKTYIKLEKHDLACQDFKKVGELIEKNQLGDGLSKANINYIKRVFAEYKESIRNVNEYVEEQDLPPTVKSNIKSKLENYYESVILNKIDKSVNKKDVKKQDTEKPPVDILIDDEAIIIATAINVDKYKKAIKELPIAKKMLLQNYIDGYKAQCSEIHNVSAIIKSGKFNYEVDVPVLATIGSKLLSYIPYIGDYLSRTVDYGANFAEETKIEAKANNVIKFRGGEQQFNLITKYIIYSAVSNSQKIDIVLHKAESIVIAYEERCNDIIDKIKEATIYKVRNFAEDKVLKYYKIVQQQDGYQYTLGIKDANDVIEQYIASGAYTQNRSNSYDIKQYKVIIDGLQHCDFLYSGAKLVKDNISPIQITNANNDLEEIKQVKSKSDKTKKKKGCGVCEIFVAQEGEYVNPLMNDKELFYSLSDILGINNVLNLSQTLIDNGHTEFMQSLISMGNTDAELWQDVLGADQYNL